MPNERQVTMYTEKYPAPVLNADVVAALMPDQRQAAPYVPHIPTDRHSDDVAVQAPASLAAPITSVGHAVPFSRLTHTTTSGHWLGLLAGTPAAYWLDGGGYPASLAALADDVVTLDELFAVDMDFADFS